MAKKFITKVEEKLIEDLLSEKLSSFRPSVSFKENTYNRLLKKMSPQKSWSFNFHRWISVGTASLAVFLCLGVTTGYAYFSPNVNSESNLYFLKKSVENVEYNLAFSEEDKIKTLVKFNEKRKEEIAVLAQEGIEDKIAIKEIEGNLNKSVLLLGKIKDPKVKEELLVLIQPTTTAAAKQSIEEVDDKDEDEKPVIVEEDPKKTPIWNLGIILPPQPTLNLSKDVLKLEVGDDGEEDESAEADGLGMGDGGDFGDDYEVDFGDALEQAAPAITPLQPIIEPLDWDVELEPVCRQTCKSGATQLCKGGTQTCGDFDKDGCTEWGKCMPVEEEEEDDKEDDGEIFFEPVIEPIKIDDPIIKPTPVVTPIKTPTVTPTPIKLTPIKITPFNFGF